MKLSLPIKLSFPRVLLVGPSFSVGGAEGRFMSIANHLFGSNNDVALLVTGETLKHHIAGEVIDLGWNGRLSYLKVIWRIVRKIRSKRYELLMAFGFFPCVVSIVALLFIGGETKLIISEITRPEMAGRLRRGKIYNFIRKILYARSSLITANSIDGLRETCEMVGVPVKDGVRVFNAIDVNCLDTKAVAESNVSIPKKKFVVCVARLEFMKRIDTVINALSFLAGRIDCDLVIVGDGVARFELESQVELMGLHNSVVFTGRLDNPFPVLTQASAFVLASEYEGFSNSVLEAMFCDIPVITSFCSSDAREMCDQGAALGFEVGNYKHLAEHIASVVTDDKLSQKLVQSARDYRAPHALENAIPFYEDLICKVVDGSLYS